jgi:ParB family chromosome partitioning protein
MSPDISYQVFQIPVHLIEPNPNQPRRIFDDEMLNELAESIRQYGFMQPISVRKVDQHYEVIAGERRLRAAKLLFLETIPALVVNVTEKDSAILALIENLQRENLSYMEEAKGYAFLIENFELKQQELADQLGKSQSAIANKLRLLALPTEVQNILLTSNLSERHARALLKLKDQKDQLDLVKQIVEKELTVSESEKLIKKTLNQKIPEKNQNIQKQQIKGYLKDIRLFTNTIKQAVEMVKTSGLEVDYQIKQTDEAYEISILIPIEK